MLPSLHFEPLHDPALPNLPLPLSFPAARLTGSLLPAWRPQSQLPTLRNAVLSLPCVLMQILPSLPFQAKREATALSFF